MKKTILLFCFITSISWAQESNQLIDKQGEITFFSYTSVENIEASNNQAVSVLKPSTSEIVVRILMRAFTFEKALMQEHFNESYIESDLFPEATFVGKIIDFNLNQELQTKQFDGQFTLHGITKKITFNAKILKADDTFEITGTLKVPVKDYDIKIPGLLAPNIAETISINFNFQYQTYEK